MVALGAEASPFVEGLVARGVSVALAVEVVEQARDALGPFSADRPLKALVHDALARRIPVAPLSSGGRVVGFVGPAGAGKTRCVAKLAAAHARSGSQPVTAIALRPQDGGSELARLLAPLGVPMHAVDDPRDLSARLADLRTSGLVILDTPGVSPKAEAELRALEAELGVVQPDELHLTMPATIGAAAARELLRAALPLGVGALTVTHVDETDQLGTVVALAVDRAVPLSYLVRGQSVQGGLAPADAGELAGALLG